MNAHRILLLGFSLLAIASVSRVSAQGRVNFSNGSTTMITTNDLFGNLGPISGAGNYLFGLYMGPAGSTASSLQLVLMATNTALAGRISGGNPAALPGGYGNGTVTYPLVFQIRGWAAYMGNTWEEAQLYFGPKTPVLGYSTLGSVTPTTSPTAAPALFGTGPGQVGGFALAVPEPSSLSLWAAGALAFLVMRWRKRSS